MYKYSFSLITVDENGFRMVQINIEVGKEFRDKLDQAIHKSDEFENRTHWFRRKGKDFIRKQEGELTKVREEELEDELDDIRDEKRKLSRKLEELQDDLKHLEDKEDEFTSILDDRKEERQLKQKSQNLVKEIQDLEDQIEELENLPSTKDELENQLREEITEKFEKSPKKATDDKIERSVRKELGKRWEKVKEKLSDRSEKIQNLRAEVQTKQDEHEDVKLQLQEVRD